MAKIKPKNKLDTKIIAGDLETVLDPNNKMKPSPSLAFGKGRDYFHLNLKQNLKILLNQILLHFSINFLTLF